MNKTLLPKLRFPEFQEVWDVEKLGNISMFINERVSLEKLSLDNYISTENILPDYEGVTKASKLPPSGSAIQYKKDDILISNIRPYLKKVWFSNKEGGASNDVIIVRAKEKITANYLSFMLRNDVFIEYVMNGAKGVKMPRGDIFLMKEYPLAYPSKPEQQKIADCLTSLNDLIAAQSQKVAALQTYKKGLMQNLFPAEGQSMPRLRFPEFQSAGEWEEKTIGELGDVFMCKRIFAEETNSSDGVPFFKIGTLGGKPDAFISKELFDEYKSKYNYPRKGEILITCSGTVGKCLAYDGSDAYYQDSNIVWIDNPTLEISNEFLRSVLLNVDWGSLNSTTITRIYMSDLRDLSILFPANQKEQQRIAELLSALDEQISAQSEALAALKVHKKGLMQGLFPKETSEVLKTSEV